jgi:hypothetical protein
MIVLVCGSRDWSNQQSILQRLKALPADSTIIHGGCRGADILASIAANQLGYKVICFPAQWDLHGKSAGPKRNQQMIDEGNPELVIAFHENVDSSKGTKDMINRAKKHKIKYEIITE